MWRNHFWDTKNEPVENFYWVMMANLRVKTPQQEPAVHVPVAKFPRLPGTQEAPGFAGAFPLSRQDPEWEAWADPSAWTSWCPWAEGGSLLCWLRFSSPALICKKNRRSIFASGLRVRLIVTGTIYTNGSCGKRCHPVGKACWGGPVANRGLRLLLPLPLLVHLYKQQPKLHVDGFPLPQTRTASAKFICSLRFLTIAGKKYG